MPIRNACACTDTHNYTQATGRQTHNDNDNRWEGETEKSVEKWEDGKGGAGGGGGEQKRQSEGREHTL